MNPLLEMARQFPGARAFNSLPEAGDYKRKIQMNHDVISLLKRNTDLRQIFAGDKEQYLNPDDYYNIPSGRTSCIDSIANELQKYLKTELGIGWQDIYRTFFSTDFKAGILDMDKISKINGDQGAMMDALVIGLWRLQRNVFRFDPSLFLALKDTEESKIPSSCLDRFPFWSTYFEFPYFVPVINYGRDQVLRGVVLTSFSAVKSESKNSDTKFLITTITQDAELNKLTTHTPTMITNNGGYLNFQYIINKPPTHPADSWSRWVEFWLSCNLLLFSNQYLDTIYNENNGVINNPVPKQKKNILRWAAPDKTRDWIIGRDIGERIRQHQQNRQGSISQKSPHIRRAHWHTYLTGKRSNPVPILKWIPPIPIAMPKTAQEALND